MVAVAHTVCAPPGCSCVHVRSCAVCGDKPRDRLIAVQHMQKLWAQMLCGEQEQGIGPGGASQQPPPPSPPIDPPPFDRGRRLPPSLCKAPAERRDS